MAGGAGHGPQENLLVRLGPQGGEGLAPTLPVALPDSTHVPSACPGAPATEKCLAVGLGVGGGSCTVRAGEGVSSSKGHPQTFASSALSWGCIWG